MSALDNFDLMFTKFDMPHKVFNNTMTVYSVCTDAVLYFSADGDYIDMNVIDYSGDGEKTLKKVLDRLSAANEPIGNLLIMYRTYGPNDEDLFAGYCRYKDGELIPEDGDSYSLNDKIIDYKFDYDDDDSPYLIVWYKSEWISG